jgi:hypothetical protein
VLDFMCKHGKWLCIGGSHTNQWHHLPLLVSLICHANNHESPKEMSLRSSGQNEYKSVQAYLIALARGTLGNDTTHHGTVSPLSGT